MTYIVRKAAIHNIWHGSDWIGSRVAAPIHDRRMLQLLLALQEANQAC